MADQGSVVSLRAFHDITSTPDHWTEYKFLDETGNPHPAGHIMFANARTPEGGQGVVYSYDGGTTTHGRLAAGDSPTFDGLYEDRVWVQNEVHGVASKLRIWAW